jgi:hypothetical protein
MRRFPLASLGKSDELVAACIGSKQQAKKPSVVHRVAGPKARKPRKNVASPPHFMTLL